MNAQTEMHDSGLRDTHAPGRQPSERGQTTILLVEDERFVREVTCEVLRAVGYTVRTAKNAAEAMQEYEACSGNVELLLTDLMLPGESGQVLASRLRRANPGLKVLLVSGYGDLMGAQDAAMEECLAKPYPTSVLLSRVREVIEGGTSAGSAREPGGEGERESESEDPNEPEQVRHVGGNEWLARSGRGPERVEPRG